MHIVFLLYSANIVDYIDFSNAYSYSKPNLVMMSYLFNIFLDVICLFFLKNCCVWIHGEYLLVIFFFCKVFGFVGNNGLRSRVRKCSLILCVLSLCGLGLFFTQLFDKINQKSLGPGMDFLGGRACSFGFFFLYKNFIEIHVGRFLIIY